MKSKIFSVMITLAVVGILILAGPASAFLVSLEKPVVKGSEVSFTITLDSEENYSPFEQAKLIINGTNGFYSECILEVNGSVSGCSLDLEVEVVTDPSYGYGYGYGYGFDSGKIIFNVIWKNAPKGEYTAHVLVGDYNSEEQFFEVKSNDNGNGNDKILICHIPKGNPKNAHTISVSSNAVEAHLKHGDYLGKCKN